jgi:hypothetical protein
MYFYTYFYRKLVETFHIVSKCNTAVYFSWCLAQVLAQPVQLFWLLVTFNVTSGNSLTDSDLVFPMSSIEYTGTRVIGHFFNYSSTRVLRSSIEYS